jgi:hypothetical protein
MAYIINFFGEGIRYWVCDIPLKQYEQFETIKKRTNSDWETILFDLDFLSHFGYSNWSELSKNQEVKSFKLNFSNKIEIKERNKILVKIPSIQILNQSSLFDLYSSEKINLNFEPKENCKTIILVQHEIGLIAKYQIESNSFNIEKLHFEVTKNSHEILNANLSTIRYDEEELKVISEDVLVKSMLVMVI